MADIFTKAKRSEVMSRIRSRGNQDTEVVLAKLLRRHQITGWRRQLQLKIKNLKLKTAFPVRPKQKLRTPQSALRILKVRPDFVFRKQKLAIFVDGCFWHGCPRHGTQPRGNRAFWQKKFATNLARDRRVNRALRAAKWRVVRIWECDLKKKPLQCLERIRKSADGAD
jgi:DNA mismatch endonuclease (patch repair protein)